MTNFFIKVGSGGPNLVELVTEQSLSDLIYIIKERKSYISSRIVKGISGIKYKEEELSLCYRRVGECCPHSGT